MVCLLYTSCADGLDLILAHQVLLCFQSLIYSHGDIGGLLVDGGDNRAVVCVEAVFSAVVADLANSVTNDFLNIYISLGGCLLYTSRCV